MSNLLPDSYGRGSVGIEKSKCSFWLHSNGGTLQINMFRPLPLTHTALVILKIAVNDAVRFEKIYLDNRHMAQYLCHRSRSCMSIIQA